jgi:thioesterase domain-containing protein
MDDDFFELGGTSLQALRIFARIEADLGRSLSPTTIVQAPTIARLAEFTRLSTDVTASEPLVPLRLSGKNSPLFLAHNRYCFVMYYRHLLSALKSDRPVFALQPPPLDARNRIPRTIEAMAADYVPEIRRVQPHGPYFLAGHSFGGRVAFEIAQQLMQAGERVEFLGLMDTALHDGPAEPWRIFSKAGFRSLLLQLLRLVRGVFLGIPNDLRIRLNRSVPLTQRPLYYDWLCTRANGVYVPKPYPGHITMFASEGNSERQKSHWGKIARGGMTVLEIPAGHDAMVLPPHSERLAEYFDACLACSEH